MRRSPPSCRDRTAADFDAELLDWVLVAWPGYDDVYVIVGVVAGDRKGRFIDRRTVLTSVLLSPVNQIHEGAIVQTQNTRYLLGQERRRN